MADCQVGLCLRQNLRQCQQSLHPHHFTKLRRLHRAFDRCFQKIGQLFIRQIHQADIKVQILRRRFIKAFLRRGHRNIVIPHFVIHRDRATTETIHAEPEMRAAQCQAVQTFTSLRRITKLNTRNGHTHIKTIQRPADKISDHVVNADHVFGRHIFAFRIILVDRIQRVIIGLRFFKRISCRTAGQGNLLDLACLAFRPGKA